MYICKMISIDQGWKQFNLDFCNPFDYYGFQSWVDSAGAVLPNEIQIAQKAKLYTDS